MGDVAGRVLRAATTPRFSGRRSLVPTVVLTLLAMASIAHAEGFGKSPGATESRCARLVANRALLNIGQRIVLKAGPVTSLCGSPASETVYNWQTTDQTNPDDAFGLVQVHACKTDAPRCVYRAFLFTQPHMWQSLGIEGNSADGGWGSTVPYAIRHGRYFGVNVIIEGGQPKSVEVKGGGHKESNTADQSSEFQFALLPGTYTFSYTLAGHSFHRKIHIDKPAGNWYLLRLAATSFQLTGPIET
jgi:hypothetical protein